MGSNYWGRCYVIGAAFWALAALTPLHLTLAPLGFGLLMLGLRLRRLGQPAPDTPRPSPSQNATMLYKQQK